MTATSATLDFTTDVLTVSNGGVTVATLQLDAAAAGEAFTTSSDGSGGTDINAGHPTSFNVGGRSRAERGPRGNRRAQAPNTGYTFNFENNIHCSDAQLASFNLASGDTVTISGVGAARPAAR